MNILVTGSAGYIGSTFCYKCLGENHSVLGIDNFSNSTKKNINILKNTFKKFEFIEHDLTIPASSSILKKVTNANIDVVVHFAALKAVGESEIQPLHYWENNLGACINTVKLMNGCNISKLIFSSSATVYGDAKIQPVNENDSLMPLSTYGSTKIASEYFLNDISKLNNLDVLSLRYFNPVASHKDKKIFEDPNEEPNNLMPRIIRVALGLDKKLLVFGDDYDTKDGTGERDYIHIEDLVDGHFSAMHKIKNQKGYDVFNLGTGKSISVMELIQTFEKVNNLKIPYELTLRRSGDIAKCFADPAKSNTKLGWSAKMGIEQMCIDAWAPFKDS